MRRLTTLAILGAGVGAIACASAGTLPGGPPDTEAPVVVGFSPESGAVNFRGRAVTVQFDETVSDRGTGASALEALVSISPRDGEPRISWSRNRIAVRPRDGFLPNTAYRITVGPGIADIRGNRSTAARSVVFSTGPTIPEGAVSGVAFDWPGQAFARSAMVEALRVADSAVFVTPVDSSGTFTVGPLTPGTYVVRGYVDQNRNRVLDRGETWDSARVTVSTTAIAGLELLLAQRDTFPARLQTVSVLDSVSLALEFDKPLDPAQRFEPGQVRIVREDSAAVPVVALVTRAVFDSSRRAARDTAGDTARAVRPAPGDSARADTAALRMRPSRPAPPRAFVATLGTPLTPRRTYRVSVTGFRALGGRAEAVSRLITVPERAAPTPPDSARRATPSTPPASRRP